MELCEPQRDWLTARPVYLGAVGHFTGMDPVRITPPLTPPTPIITGSQLLQIDSRPYNDGLM
jgi:hypothetical protein